MRSIHIGLCGLGFIGKTHAICYRAMEMTTPVGITPVLDRLCSRSEAEHPYFKKVAADFEEIIQDKSIELIDICTPDFLHYSQAKAVIESGKSLYLEKPIAQTIKQARQLATAAEQAGIINQTALVMRFQPKIAAARDVLNNGDLGEIIHFKARILNNSYLNPNRPVNWRLQSSLAAGGSLMDTGVHVADLIRFLLGEVQEVSCRTSVHFKERFTDESKTEKVQMDNDEWSFMQITLSNGITGELETSRIAAGVVPRNDIEIFGTNGFMYIDLLSTGYLRIYRYDLGKEFTGPIAPSSEWAKHLNRIHPLPMFDMGIMLDEHSACAMNLLCNIEAGKILYPETPTLWEGYMSQTVIEMGYRSARESGRKVTANEVLMEN